SVTILGSTGSIGTQAIDVVRHASERFTVCALASGGSDVALLAEQAAALGGREVGIGRADAADELSERIRHVWREDQPLPRIVAGPGSAAELAASHTDVVLNAVAGAAGLRATLAALDAGRFVALANKESLI